MKFRSCWLIFTLIGLSLTSCGQQKSSQEIAETVNKSLVLIYYENQGGHGTGFIVPGKKGVCTVLTAGHVVKGYSLKLQTYQDKQGHTTDSIQTSPTYDLAVVTFKSAGENCPYQSVNFGDSNELKVGHKIYISGFPVIQNEDLAPEFLEGSVSRINVVLPEGYGINYTAQVSVGISGAPVLDTSGKVVAVHGQAKDKLPRGIPIKTYQANQSWENQPITKADYTKLEQLLDAGKWKEADGETANKMLEVAGRQQEGELRVEDVENFSCPDLRAMDRLWVKYSDGRFGFSVQKKIHQSLGGTKEYNEKVSIAYYEAIGWKMQGEKGAWRLLPNYTDNPPFAHLPWFSSGGVSCGIGSVDVGVCHVSLELQRLVNCKL
ncbi:GUN4 domain-containing protein [Microcoleus sp. herbarium12]|uniref:GUN4 domain-containing protein n=1 Tax=Microcoleus sp. herbarium12 TaxID=3055437 RepID=UPI002FD2AE13